MTRRDVLLSVVAALLLLVLGAAPVRHIGTAAPIPIDYGHEIVRIDFQFDGEGYVEGVDIWHGDSTERHLSVLAETPTPSPTSTATASFTPAPTLTPPPTNTPRPTATNTPAPVMSPTPTRENTPPPTPAETSIPPDESICYAGVISSGLNVRSNPSTSGLKYGTLPQAARVQVFIVHVVKPEGDPAREEWGMVTYQDKTAWIALWYAGTELARLDDRAPCWELPIEYETAMAPMCLGWHSVLPNVDLNDMQASFIDWKLKGQCVAAKGVEEIHAPVLALAFGGIGAVRFARGPTQNGDCADTSLAPNTAALDMARRILPIALIQAPPSEGFIIEGGNECQGIYFQNLSWLNQYLAAEIRTFSAYYPRVIFGTMLAGAWTQERVNALRLTWDTALETGACLGIHAGSPLAEYDAVQGLSIEWLWKYSFQHRDIRRWLVQLDPRYVAIPFCVTEWASGGGWSAYRAEDYYSWAEEVKHDGILFAAVFTAGNWNAYGVNGHMADTARLWPPK